MSESKPDAGILSCRWRRRGGGVKPHFLFMRFHGLLLVVPELCVCVCVRVCVCVCAAQCVRANYKQSTWGHHTHIVLSQQHIAPHWERKNKSMPVCRRCQCVWLRTHTHTHAFTVWCSCRLEGGKQYSMQPTTYNVRSFCFLRQTREKRNIYLTTTASFHYELNTHTVNPHAVNSQLYTL